MGAKSRGLGGLVARVLLAVRECNVEIFSVLANTNGAEAFLCIGSWGFSESFGCRGSSRAETAWGRSERGSRKSLDADMLLLCFLDWHD
jgi:hypothetical protein